VGRGERRERGALKKGGRGGGGVDPALAAVGEEDENGEAGEVCEDLRCGQNRGSISRRS
jgi:hypothetical protein